MLCKKILDNVYGKFLDEPNENFSNLTEASMSGLKCLDPLIDFDAFMVFLCELHDKKCKIFLGVLDNLQTPCRSEFYVQVFT